MLSADIDRIAQLLYPEHWEEGGTLEGQREARGEVMLMLGAVSTATTEALGLTANKARADLVAPKLVEALHRLGYDVERKRLWAST